MTATHATRVTNLRPRVDLVAEAGQLHDELVAAIITVHVAEHANVHVATCANPICRAYVAQRWAGVA